KPISMIEEAYSCGIRDFGENKVQELVDKYEKLPKDIKWHLIGHLQSNKVKYIVDKAYLIHSVDSLKLAKEISKEALKKNVICKILIEVNVAEEESKFGVSIEQTEELIKEISVLPGIKICGLMTVAPFTTNSEENRPVFIKLKQLFIDIKSKNIDNVFMEIMSMGMSGDYEVAVEEGATYVRVGTKIFGERNYNV
ncbi:MAG: YggS family pyridoxal phosphate-dependent enzyme, partial [Lachnospiraceae bacterium]|nr:YggS family pyridoxal phosphate-dependent enzyme [Lachnospiraceae bacterium]